MPPREAFHVVRLVRLQHIRLEQRVVRDALEHEAVIGERMLVVLQVLPELLLRRDRPATAPGGAASRRGRAGPARPRSGGRAGCSTRVPGVIDSDTPTMLACIGSRLVVSVSNATSSAASMAASQRASAASSTTISYFFSIGGAAATTAEVSAALLSQRRPAVSSAARLAMAPAASGLPASAAMSRSQLLNSKRS